jgi:LysR family cyn operon transcriptional activator
METDLSLRLFDRVGRRVQVTSEGEGLLRRSRRLLAEADSLGERARMLKAGETGILRVGATPQVIENLLAQFLTTYRRRTRAWRSLSWRTAAFGSGAASSAVMSISY